GSGPRGDPGQALFDSDRRRLRSMDQAIHLFPWQTPPQGNGGGGNRGVPDRFGSAEESGRRDAEPSAQRAGFSLQGGFALGIGRVFGGEGGVGGPFGASKAFAPERSGSGSGGGLSALRAGPKVSSFGP